jgi:alpha-L-rhamnosidase
MIKYLLFFILASSTFVQAQKVSVFDLTCEDKTNPLGIDELKPRLSWKIKSSLKNVMQTAYSIRVSKDEKFTKGSIVWESGQIKTDASMFLPYAGQALESNKKYFWQVKVWDNKKNESAWSETAFWQMGLLKPEDWTAKWVEGNNVVDSANGPALIFRKQFAAAKSVKSATAYITSHGLYEAMINGKRVGDYYLTPGWTSYNKRLQYQIYDVTSLLQSGDNAIGVTVGSGWYRTKLGWTTNKNIYGSNLALLLQINVTYADGTEATIISDESWKVTDQGPIRFSEIYDGEVYDASKEIKGWSAIGFDDAQWKSVSVKNHPKEILIATSNEPIRKQETFKPKQIIKTPKGETVIDFGQNLVGWLQFKVTGKAGDKVVFKHVEVLDKDGNVYTDNLRDADQENTFILKGGAEEIFEPHFTFQGFRYIKVEGHPGELKPENFTAIALYSDMEPTGTFTCSNPLLNQLQHNIQWGQKGNFLDVPTDCPQRDERLGWTGDAQVFARTASFNMNVHNFFAKWMKDVAADQDANGSVPFVVPNVLKDSPGGSAGWADAATVIPWEMFIVYGDKKVLEDQYESMKKWVGFIEANSTEYLWNKGFHFGDWLFYRPFDDNDGRSAVTDKYLIAQCFWAHSTQLLINAAQVLKKEDDVKKYEASLQKIKEAFLKEYVTANGRLVSSTQTAYVLALNFDMLPEGLRQQAAERLVANIKDYDYHLTTGFLGTPYLCHVLTRYRYTDVAYKLLLQETYPSWLYPVKIGATTIWERWDGQKPDSTFQTPGMNSFNHYAYGAIGDWMYRVVTGIDADVNAPAYKHIIIKPRPGGDLTNASSKYETSFGLVSSSWEQSNGQFTFDVEIPANTTATISIPTESPESINENGKPLSANKDLKTTPGEEGYITIETGSGRYHFTSKLNPKLTASLTDK